MQQENHDGNNSISEISLRVKNDHALTFWKKRFEELNVEHEEITEVFNRQTLRFKDFEGQRMALISDERIQELKVANRGKKAQCRRSLASLV